MYRSSYNMNMPSSIYRGSATTTTSANTAGGYYDERGFWIPFVVGGLAGGALGYGVANNNFLSHNGGYYNQPRPCCQPGYPAFYGPYPFY